MVLPSIVLEQKEAEEASERTKEEEAEEGKMEGAEEGSTAEELDQARVVVPTPPDTGKVLL